MGNMNYQEAFYQRTWWGLLNKVERLTKQLTICIGVVMAPQAADLVLTSDVPHDDLTSFVFNGLHIKAWTTEHIVFAHIFCRKKSYKINVVNYECSLLIAFGMM